MARDAVPKLKNISNGKGQMANGKSKENTRFENRNWKLEIEDVNPKRAVSARFIAARFAIYLLRSAFCLAL
jgi:hypothetical protein